MLAPAALERSIQMDNAERVRANLVLEIANHGHPEATRCSTIGRVGRAGHPGECGRRDRELPGVDQNLQRERWTEDRVNGRLKELMEAATDLVLGRTDEDGVSLRAAAYEIAVERVANAGRARGWH